MEFAEAVGHEPDLSVCKKANQGDVPQGVDGLDLIGHRRAEGKFASLAGEEQYRVHIWTNSSPPDYRPAVRTRQAGAANSFRHAAAHGGGLVFTAFEEPDPEGVGPDIQHHRQYGSLADALVGSDWIGG